MIKNKLRKKLIKNSFYINLFETTVFVITNKKDFQEVYDNIKYNANTDDVHGLCLSTTDDGVKDIFIGIFSNRQDILVHECVHASLYILSNIGEEANERSELQPYLVQTLFRECNNIFNLET